MNRLIPLIATLLLTACAGTPPEPAPRTIYVVRHAETVEGGQERALSEAGHARARRIADAVAAQLAEDAPPLLLSTDYVRTRQTLAPLAERTGAPVEGYDPGDLVALAERIAGVDAAVIVIAGHSNTIRETVTALGGESGSPVSHDEHDRLYRLTIHGRTGAVSTMLLSSDP